MTDYTITTDFGAKDSLPSGDANKVVKGSEFTTEFTNIQTAINTKADSAGDTFTGVVNFNASAVFNNDVIVDGDTLFVDVSTDRVGIGTNSPQAQLHVKNNDAGFEVDVDGQISDGVRLLAYDRNTSTNRNMQYSASQHLFTIGSSEKMRINTSGHVGIGTVSPDQKAHLSGAGTQYLRVENTTNSVVTDFGTSSTGSTIINRSAHPIEFFTDSTKRMTIDATGNVGIGTDSPDSALEVQGSVNGTHQIHIQNTFDDDDEVAPNPLARLLLSAASNNGYLEAHGAPEDSAGLHKIDLGSTAVNSFLTFSPANTERMRIDSSGNVGIGTTSPDADLHINNTSGSELRIDTTGGSNVDSVLNFRENGVDRASLYWDGADNDLYLETTAGDIALLPSGNVGIGTTSPSAKATIEDVDFARLDLNLSNSTGTQIADVRGLVEGTEKWRIGKTASNSDDFTINVGSTERMRIDATGKVGIGTSSPSYPLDVDGLIASRDAYLITANSSGTPSAGAFMFRPASNTLALGTNSTERMRIDSSGNLLVGTTDTSLYNNTSGEGFSVVNNELGIAKSGTCAYFNRMGSDGENVKFFKDGSTVGSIGVSGSRPYLSNGVNDGIKIADDYVAPCNQTGGDKDASLDLGSSSVRFKDIYRSGSTYSTSDRNKKQDIRDLTDAEARVATVAKGSLKAFRYIDSVEAEGDEANIHFGIIAQDLKAAFEAEGLNANDYQVFKTSTYTDDDGVEQTTYSVCYENLLAFIIAAI